mmetsp:Transcript_53615/g.113865  ORF Transcript_53615/g.113865 Transcript_53615/m.113865 type:complete len:467 (-) Transcript_53615:73-1473(-)
MSMSTTASTSDDLPPNVRSLVRRAKDLFEESFGSGAADDDERTSDLPPSCFYCASAPGRVNLIGEHTDYTGGYVLPLAIGYNTVCYGRGGVAKKKLSRAAAPLKSRIVSTTNDGDGSVVEFAASPSLAPSSGADRWANYVQGVVLQYLPDLEDDETFVLDMAIAGDVPLGSGLSSSASLEVATAVFLEGVMSRHEGGVAYSSRERSNVDDATMSLKEVKMERAVRCQRAENVFCDVPCGIMDQFVSSAGRRGRLLLIDCRSLDYHEVSAGSGEADGDDDAPVLVVANSNVAHDLGAGEYPVRVRQCGEATEILSGVDPRIRSLRDASPDDVDAAAASAGLGGVLFRRARHVVSENKRTVEAADALEKGDWETVGRLMNESHSSMRDDYEVSCDEIDVLVDAARGFDGVYGSRLTGGGFGGCTVTLVKKESSRGLINHLIREYEEKTGRKCTCFETSPGDGAKAISV